MENTNSKAINNIVLVAALGYFVDVYDLILFGMVRISSLTELGLKGESLDKVGISLHNWQMIGMMVGGIFWGILGDKKGRLSVLFASILTYSIANIANGAVETTFWYGVWRFVAGFGLAGELGVGITLVSESMSKEKRGYGTMLVASVGVTGAIVAAVLTNFLDWRTVYYIGGGLGLSLLLLRVGVIESSIYKNTEKSSVEKGNFFMLFKETKTLVKYLKCIIIGIPIWWVIGFLILYATKFVAVSNISTGLNYKAEQPFIIMLYYIGLTFGDVLSGMTSQWLKSRKKAVLIFYPIIIALALVYLFFPIKSPMFFYTICVLLGVACGYWAIFITISAEQFGTNIRSTVSTTAPNFVRGAFVLLNLLLDFFNGYLDNLLSSVLIVGVIVFGGAIWAIMTLPETFGKDLDYNE